MLLQDAPERLLLSVVEGRLELRPAELTLTTA
jgi:hypothetical protein